MSPQERLTYETATAEQVAAARERARARLVEAAERQDAGHWERLRARLGVTADPA